MNFFFWHGKREKSVPFREDRSFDTVNTQPLMETIKFCHSAAKEREGILLFFVLGGSNTLKSRPIWDRHHWAQSFPETKKTILHADLHESCSWWNWYSQALGSYFHTDVAKKKFLIFTFQVWPMNTSGCHPAAPFPLYTFSRCLDVGLQLFHDKVFLLYFLFFCLQFLQLYFMSLDFGCTPLIRPVSIFIHLK